MNLIGLIVTYNRLDYLKVTIQKSLDFGFDEILIIDNASTDGTNEFLNSLKEKKILSVRLSENGGGAGGFFEGIRLVKEKYREGWVCLFDDDSYPDVSRDVVEVNLQNVKHAGCVAAAVLLPNGNVSEMNRASRNPFKTLKSFIEAGRFGKKSYSILDSDYHGQLQEIDWSSFVGCFVNIQSLQDSGVMPRKEFFIYGDDVLFTYQLTTHGYKNYFVPDIRFIHDCQAYDKNAVYTSLWKVYFHYRNVLEIYRIIAKKYFPLVLMRYLVSWTLAIPRYGTNRMKYSKVAFMAFKDWSLGNYKLKLPELLNKISKM